MSLHRDTYAEINLKYLKEMEEERQRLIHEAQKNKENDIEDRDSFCGKKVIRSGSGEVYFEVKDSSLVDEKKIKSAGAAGVIRPSKTAVQVVVGTKVQFVADEFKKLCK